MTYPIKACSVIINGGALFASGLPYFIRKTKPCEKNGYLGLKGRVVRALRNEYNHYIFSKIEEFPAGPIILLRFASVHKLLTHSRGLQKKSFASR